MKVLILTMLLGAGHNEVARNIAKECTDNGHEVITCELFKDHKFHSWLIRDVSFKAMSKAPKIANYFYERALKSDKQAFSGLVQCLKEELVGLINEYAPDVIVSTHIAGRIFVKKYQSLFVKPVLNYFVVTDYELTPGLKEFDERDYVVVPNVDFIDGLINKGAKKENVLPLGIPINCKFFNNITPEMALQETGLTLDETKRTVLVVGGGSGLGNNYQVIKTLSKYPDMTIISVAGKNERLKNAVDRLIPNAKATIISFGFNKQIDYLMCISDILVGKAGGLTSSEAISKNLPLAVVGNTPRPELSNLEYLMNKGIAIQCNNVKKLYECLLNADLISMRNNCEKIKMDNPAKNVYEHIMSKLNASN